MLHLNHVPKNHPEIIPFSERTIVSSNTCFCIPSLGQIVEGYCLILPKRQVLNLSLLHRDEKKDMLQMANSLNQVLSRIYGPTIVFEQGATENRDSVGCGVDRAHLHIVPNFSLERMTEQLDNKYPQISLHRDLMTWLMGMHVAFRPYMMIGCVDGPVFVYDYGERRESQVIRKILAAIAPGHSEWDWRASGIEDRLWETLDIVKKALSG